MAWVTRDWNGVNYNKLAVIPHKTDMNCFRLVKIRQPVTCSTCGKKLPKKCYVYGSDWTRLCLKCGEAFSHQAIKEFENVIDFIKTNLDYLEDNRDKLNAENIVACL